MMRSQQIKEGLDRAGHRSLLMATGVAKEQFKAPFIGIASSFSDLVPGHIGMRDLERQIEKGIHSGGGQAFIFGVPAVCDGIAMGHDGMRYSLPSRDLIADCIETVANAHQLDGLVLLSNCDKITPAMLIAAARLNIPSIIVTAGPMLDGESQCEKLTMIRGAFEAVGKYRDGLIDEKRLIELEEASCPSAGACQGLYTANTMACLTEVMGMSLPWCATASAVSSHKRRIAFDSGMQIVELVKQNKRPLDIITKDALRNAIIADLAMGGSTNSFLHILALANAANLDVSLEDFDQAGGINAVLNVLLNDVPEFKDLEGVTLRKTSELVENSYVDEKVIHSYSQPFTTKPGLGVLKGNIAPNGSVIKISAVDESCYEFKGKAKVFNSEEDAMSALENDLIKEGDVITRSGFTSTAPVYDYAVDRFNPNSSDIGAFSKGYVMRITLPKGTKGLDYRGVDLFGGKKSEFVLPPNSEIKVNKIDHVNQIMECEYKLPDEDNFMPRPEFDKKPKENWQHEIITKKELFLLKIQHQKV